LENARDVLPYIIEIFQKINPLILKNVPDDRKIRRDLKKFSDSSNDTIPICILGNYSSGKSTFITNFMNKLVLPRVKNNHARERMIDELPQSANGKVVMTTQPKFVPNEAVAIELGEQIEAKIRLVDCVG
jgi:stage IV sporulation protein A